MTLFDLGSVFLGKLMAENLELHHRVTQLEKRVEQLSGSMTPEAPRIVRPKTPPRRFRAAPLAEGRAQL
ncbi:hypothetical protein [Paracoccus tibetensis]|uniref:hypothetical protein n=1 Tax=Paracoccus tibetensis TaxID=336292 RepID=UPI001113A832|nr:hypothetical protein [Paracoccus tibetensis]